MNATSVQSYDFVKSKYPLSPDDGDVITVFSHRGTKMFSVAALEVAKAAGVPTILVTGIGSLLLPKIQVFFG